MKGKANWVYSLEIAAYIFTIFMGIETLLQMLDVPSFFDSDIFNAIFEFSDFFVALIMVWLIVRVNQAEQTVLAIEANMAEKLDSAEANMAEKLESSEAKKEKDLENIYIRLSLIETFYQQRIERFSPTNYVGVVKKDQDGSFDFYQQERLERLIAEWREEIKAKRQKDS